MKVRMEERVGERRERKEKVRREERKARRRDK